MSLVVDWCEHKAARFAVEHWHYSKRMPMGKANYLGVWEDGEYIGAVIFSWGGAAQAATMGLTMPECVELVRVALRAHTSPVSQIVAIAVRMMKARYPQLRVVVSFADPVQGHRGGIYQAGNWLYLGETKPARYYRMPDGTVRHQRSFSGRQFGTVPADPLPAGAVSIVMPGKHRYAMPLDRPMRRQLLPLCSSYPRGSGVEGDTSPLRGEGAGSIPANRST